MTSAWITIAGLAAGTFTIRLSGYLLGARLPASGPWARALKALPGSLIVALLTVLLIQGGPAEWVASAIALAVALATRNLPLTMLAGLVAVAVVRNAL
ncbi:hypothetical protein U879_18825 [Defluviimonas sp. 20V17]|uniref:Uncharacterized membrane protein n=1 Tax=Allgaiera indica TaxID=765699 RepID=A0AAN4USK7_9RHOB|nr:AzlD domain-containing protein [Allgaiera indica]KDB02134.1 hypothetical protein U879_18825 [Defluviimonas sp. 20V17]GHE02970.1 hypothetical protein GCM10008024_24480 [Allgaiera indica]SDX13700.1 Uncharacterized membrane protein [Allgaiera indica]